MSSRFRGAVALFFLTSVAAAAPAERKDEKLAEPITKGQRVFTCGHSFHVWVPAIVADLVQEGGDPGSRPARRVVDRRLARHSALGHRRREEQGQGGAEDRQGRCADAVADLPARPGHRELHQAGPGAQQGHPHPRPADLAALGHLRADDQAARQGRSQRHHRRGAAQTARAVFQEHGRAHPRTEQETRQDGAVRGSRRRRP